MRYNRLHLTRKTYRTGEPRAILEPKASIIFEMAPEQK